jgi:hypothetical protein
VSLLRGALPAGRTAEQTLGTAHFGRQWVSLTDGRWQLQLLGPDVVHLFDLASDPGATHDVAAAQPELVRAWRAQHAALQAAAGEKILLGVPRAMDEATRRELRAFGYTDASQPPR